MKINSPYKALALYTLFGAMAFAFAFFAPVDVKVAAACEYDSYYGDYVCDDGYAYADECDYYGDCDDYSYEDNCDYYDDCDDYVSSNNSYSESYSNSESNAVVNFEYIIEDDEEDYDDVDGYCFASVSRAETGDTVTWEAQGSGGDEWYTYDWSGTDGLNSYYPVVDKKYYSEGTKTATVKIYSAGDTITRTCSVKIEDDEDDHDDDDDDDDRDNDDLDAYCKASPNDGETGDRIKWTVYPDGGDGDYDYDWDGDENLNGDDKSITKTYDHEGRKEAEVRVKSDGDSVTVRCYADIEDDKVVVYNPPTYTPPTGGIYLSSIPATGISPTMKVSLFVTGLLMWSAFLAYLYIARKNEKMKEEEVLAALER